MASEDFAGRGWIPFPVGQDTLCLLKAADRNGIPDSGDDGVSEFGMAVRESPEDWILLHIVVPSRLRSIRFRHVGGGGNPELAKPRTIYRTPSSPGLAFAIVREGVPGRIEALDGNRVVGSIDLRAADLVKLPLHWDKNAKSVSYAGLPASLEKWPD